MQYCPWKVQITRPDIHGLSSNDFHTLPSSINRLEKRTHTPTFFGPASFFLKGWVNFNEVSRRGGEGGIWEIKQKGWKYGAGTDLLKRGAWNFSYLIFSSFINFHSEITLSFAKLHCMLRYATIKKVIRSYLKMNLKISHKLRFISLYVKGFERLKIDFCWKTTVELVKSPFW